MRDPAPVSTQPRRRGACAPGEHAAEPRVVSLTAVEEPSAPGRLSERWTFLRQSLRGGVRIASVTPSSRWMCRELSRHVDPFHPQRILELGAGTGVVTREIEARMHPQSTLVAVEPQAEFVPMLRRGCPRARVLHGRFEQCEPELMEHAPYDVVVSGLPFPSLPRRSQAALLRLLEAAAPGAVFSQLTEIPWLYLSLYRRAFERVAFRVVPLNVPPGGVYHCRGVRRGGR